jgi:hypothetical protein
VIGSAANDSDLESVLFVPASVPINDVKGFSGVEVIHSHIFQDFERLGGNSFIDLPPPDFLLSESISDNGFGRWDTSELGKTYPVFCPE